MGYLFVFGFLFFPKEKTRRKLRWFVSQENLFFLQLLLHETARKQALSLVAIGSPSPPNMNTQTQKVLVDAIT